MEGFFPVEYVDDLEDEVELKEKFGTKTDVKNATVQNLEPKPAIIWGPYQQTTAIVFNQSKERSIRIFLGNKNVYTYHPGPEYKDKNIMVFIELGYSCWVLGGSELKSVR